MHKIQSFGIRGSLLNSVLKFPSGRPFHVTVRKDSSGQLGSKRDALGVSSWKATIFFLHKRPYNKVRTAMVHPYVGLTSREKVLVMGLHTT